MIRGETLAERRLHSDLYHLICTLNEESDPCATTKIMKWLDQHKRLASFEKYLLYRSEDSGQTPLHLLVEYDYHGAIPLLIENARGAVNLSDNDGNNPLDSGLIFCQVSLIAVKMLIEANPEALRPPRGEEHIVSKRLPIHCACSALYLRFDIIAMLLEKYPEGAKVVWKGRLPINWACTVELNLDVWNLLIERYPESVYVHSTALSKDLRSYYRCDKVIRVLQDAIIGGYSANVCQVIVSAFPESTLIKDENGILPLHLCIRHFTNFENRGNRLEVFLLLLNSAPQFVCDDAEAKTTAKMLMSTCNEDTGLLLLHQSAANRHFSLTVLEFLNAAYPSSVSKVDGCGMLPFHYACLNPDATVDALMMLLLLYPESIAANNS
jgi:ankyrin repeat protein